jgi:hypothetical protein
MPSALTLGAILATLTLHADGPPQEKLYDATVKVPEALVRSGASDDMKLYPTNRLHQGDTVEVVKEMDGGWLAIKPPAKGSFSWVNTRFLERDPKDSRIWLVHGEAPVDVLLGSELVNTKPTVVSNKKMSPGSFVVAVGQPLDDKQENDGRFLPIVPPEGELRYIRADQVVRAAPGQAGLAPPPAAVGAAPPAPPAPGGDYSRPAAPAAASTPLPPPAGGSNDPRWLDAQRLEQEGRKAEAAQKYTELAQQVYAENHDLAMQCYNRAYFLRESLQGGAAAAPPAGAQLASAAAENRLAPVPAGAPAQQANYASLQDPAAGYPPQAKEGRLRLAGRNVDTRRAYVLEDSRGFPQMYVMPQPGVDLESYVGRNVQVYGPLVYRMDIRAQYMSAQRITPLQ